MCDLDSETIMFIDEFQKRSQYSRQYSSYVAGKNTAGQLQSQELVWCKWDVSLLSGRAARTWQSRKLPSRTKPPRPVGEIVSRNIDLLLDHSEPRLNGAVMGVISMHNYLI